MSLGGPPRAAAQAVILDGDPLPPEDRVGASTWVSIDDLYREHRPRLLRFLRRRTSPDEAMDVVQKVFARLLGTNRSTSTIRSPDAYLQRAADNQVRDDARRDRRRSAQLHVHDGSVALHSIDQTAALEARDMLRRLEQAIAALKPRTREIFLAHRIDGYSYADIAQRTGLSIKAVEKQMSNAIAHLDRTLGPQ